MIFDFDFKSFSVDDFDFDFKIILRLIYDFKPSKSSFKSSNLGLTVVVAKAIKYCGKYKQSADNWPWKLTTMTVAMERTIPVHRQLRRLHAK